MIKFIRGSAIVAAVIGSLYGLVLSLIVVYELWDSRAVLLALFLFPVTFTFFPFYMLFVYGSWKFLLLNYGTWVIYVALDRLADKYDWPQRANSPQKTAR